MIRWSDDSTAIKRLFRADICDDAEQGFDRCAQLRLVSSVLTHLRACYTELWSQIHNTRGIGSLTGRDYEGVREFKKLLEHLVRTADESMDFRRTVSFVSRSVLNKISARSEGKLTIKHFNSNEFLHEHGVPVDAVVRILVHPENVDAEIYPILEALSCRTLLSREEVNEIDFKFRSSLPGHIRMPWGSYPAKVLPLRFHALSRYYAARSSLLDELVPTSKRACELINVFRAFTSESSSDVSYVKKMAKDHKDFPIAYIPDYAFDWGRSPSRHQHRV